MLSKPIRKWKNLEAARLSLGFTAVQHPNDFPCLACNGRGGYYEDCDRDTYEGYKMAQLHKCKSCDGTRLGSKAAFVEYYDKQVAKYKAELSIYDYKMKRFGQIKKQLSQEDWRILQECL